MWLCSSYTSMFGGIRLWEGAPLASSALVVPLPPLSQPTLWQNPVLVNGTERVAC